MTQRSGKKAAEILRKVQDLDPQHIDALYGLEPVYEPASESQTTHGSHLLEFVEIQCPWCGEVMGSQVDLTGGSRSYIEDCQVCCRPIEIKVEIGGRGELRELGVSRSD